MTEPEQPDTPPLTRKQLREIRNTGATTVITPEQSDAAATGSTGHDEEDGSAPAGAPTDGSASDDAVADAATVEEAATDQAAAAEEAPAAEEETDAAGPADAASPAAHLARPSEAAAVRAAPAPDASVDLGVSPLTRRQARQQERIRTASVPVITPDMAASYGSSRIEPIELEEVTTDTGSPAATDASTGGAASGEVETIDAEIVETSDSESVGPTTGADATPAVADPEAAASDEDEEQREQDAPPVLVNPMLGSAILDGEAIAVTRPPSFDQLLERGAATTGSVSAPNALILSQTPTTGSIIAPLSATGEVMVTDMFHLPEGLSSTGHVKGTADGKEADAVLVDGEIPAHSSPTPIAASSAISTIKTSDEIIRPPAPEKGQRWVLALAITAGILAVAIVGLLVVAITTGVFA